jgi:uncharacterized repeat protein (TIGR01451 family)
MVSTQLTSIGVTTVNPHAYRPGEKVELLLKASWVGNSALFTWNPPPGASNFNFSGHEPSPGGPPFLFYEVDNSEGSSGIPVSYSAPSSIPGNDTRFADSLKVETDSGDMRESMVYHDFQTSQAQAAGQILLPAGGQQPTIVLGPVSMWHVTRYVDVYDTPMTTAVCQQYVQQGQSSDMFVVMQAPVSDQILANTSYNLPVINTPTNPIQLTLTGSGKTFSMPAEIRVDATLWANQHLPAAPGQLWVAVGPDHQATITCPANFNIPASHWSMVLDLWLDLHDQPNACENCALTTYVCYRPQSSLVSSVVNWLARPLSPQAASVPPVADGLVCLGPNQIPLVSSPTWNLEAFTLNKTVLPGNALDLYYWIMNGSSAATFSLTSASNLSGATWSLYEGQTANPNLPDMSKPITSPVALAKNAFFNIHAISTVPAGAASGVYTYSLTAASAGLTPPSWKGSTTLIVGTLAEPAAPTAGVSISKSVSAGPVLAGGAITYSLTVTNSGQKLLTNLKISDPAPAHTTFSQCSGADGCSLAAGTVTWDLDNLDTGQMVILTLKVTVNGNVASGTVISNGGYGVQTQEGATANGSSVLKTVSKAINYLPYLKKAGP